MLFSAKNTFAQVVTDCDWRARADSVVEPWDQFSRTYANGAVRLALLDAIEPGAGALHLLVLSPPYDGLGARQCRVVSLDQSLGFAGVLFEDHVASYDPATGLSFESDVQVFAPELSDLRAARLNVTVNQQTGAIGARLQ